jgi:hypothetical protein
MMPDFNGGLEKYEDFCRRMSCKVDIDLELAIKYMRELLEELRREREAAWEASMGEDL